MTTAQSTKSFPTKSVLGVATGIVLEQGGFAGIHEVMDYLFPGIMTIGCAVMADRAAFEIRRQLPEVAEIASSCPRGDAVLAWADEAQKQLGSTLPIIGPFMESPDAEAEQAFGEFVERARK